MNNTSLIHADVFFFVTTVVVALVGVLLVVALVYLIRILVELDKFQKTMRAEAGVLMDDIKELREEIVSKGFRYAKPLRFLMGLAGVMRRKRRIKKF